MKKLPGSLEIKLHEKLSKSDILNILAEQMTMLEETFGIQEFKLFSYLECYIGDKKQALYYRSRNSAVATFKLKGLESPVNTAKLISKENGQRIVSFDKQLDIEKISNTVHCIQTRNPYRDWSEEIRVVPACVINKIIQEERMRKQDEQDRLYRLEQQCKKEEQIRKTIEKEKYERPLKDFISAKIQESGLSERDFKKQICSSYSYLKDRSTKSRYFTERPDLLEKYYNERLIRFSIKGTNGKVGKVEIYTDTGELIFELYKKLRPV
ncbi:TPA: hypothetical protein JK826_004500 [Salmonella enterica]|nr:hypothetical protein [Salmonella enterica subsp. enterica serovar Typhimurium]HAV7859053.1 hypothetical protein [Salmonella enterica]HAV9262383.1 hypothetical protein [Salmonella enterica]